MSDAPPTWSEVTKLAKMMTAVPSEAWADIFEVADRIELEALAFVSTGELRDATLRELSSRS